MKYILYSLPLLFVLIVTPFIFAAKTRVAEKSALTEIAQEGIKPPEGMPIVLKEGQTRETYYAKQTTMPKKDAKPAKTTPKVTSTPLAGSSAPITVTSTSPTATPVEAPKQPPVTFVQPIVVNVPTQAQQTATITSTNTTQPTTPMDTLEANFSVLDANTVRVLTNKPIQKDSTAFADGVTFVSAKQFQDGVDRVWKLTKNPAYLYDITTTDISSRTPFTVTITTGAESLTREIQLN